jgi:hypothetical protein
MRDAARRAGHQADRMPAMGKYLLGWIMGVPVFVLVIIYLLFH